MFAMLSDSSLTLVAQRFRCLAEPMRLKILHALSDHEMSVGELSAAIGSGQANVSRHLGLLLQAGLVARRKDGLNVFYRIADETIFRLCETVCTSLGAHLAAQCEAVQLFAAKH